MSGYGSGIGQSSGYSTTGAQDPLLIRKQERHGFALQLVLGKTVEYPSAGLVVATDKKFRTDTMGLYTANNVPEWQEQEIGFPSRKELRDIFSRRVFDEDHALSFTSKLP
jgi:hypothetical protein